MWKDEKKKATFFFFNCLAVGGLISQREGRNGSERDKDGSHVCTGWEMTYSAEIKFILLAKKYKGVLEQSDWRALFWFSTQF